MAVPEQAADRSARAEHECSSVDEVIAHYPGEWILLMITELDEAGWPSRGEVLAHSMNHDSVWDLVDSRPPDVASGQEYYVFQASERVRTGQGMRAALEAACQARTPDDGPRW